MIVKFSTSVVVQPDFQGRLFDQMKFKAYSLVTAIQRAWEKRKIRAMLSIPGTGRIYKSKTGFGRHQASIPGAPPAPDRGVYRDSWNVDVAETDKGYEVAMWSPLWDVFGRRLELGGWGGGAYIAPRPHIRRVIEGADAEIERELKELNA